MWQLHVVGPAGRRQPAGATLGVLATCAPHLNAETREARLILESTRPFSARIRVRPSEIVGAPGPSGVGGNLNCRGRQEQADERPGLFHEDPSRVALDQESRAGFFLVPRSGQNLHIALLAPPPVNSA